MSAPTPATSLNRVGLPQQTPQHQPKSLERRAGFRVSDFSAQVRGLLEFQMGQLRTSCTPPRKPGTSPAVPRLVPGWSLPCFACQTLDSPLRSRRSSARTSYASRPTSASYASRPTSAASSYPSRPVSRPLSARDPGRRM